MTEAMAMAATADAPAKTPSTGFVRMASTAATALLIVGGLAVAVASAERVCDDPPLTTAITPAEALK